MANPPAWVLKTPRDRGSGQFAQEKGGMMAGVAAGVVTQADVNKQPSNGGPMVPAKWSYIWFGLAVLYLTLVYSGNLAVAEGRV